MKESATLKTYKTKLIVRQLCVSKLYESPGSPDVVVTQVVMDTNINLATIVLMLVIKLCISDLVISWCWDMTGDLGEEQLLVDEVEQINAFLGDLG